MDKGPTRREGHRSKAEHNSSIVDDLAQSPTPMSALEVLQSYPKQRKALLFALCAIDLVNSCLMDFDLDNSTPKLPSLVTFQIQVSVQNINIHHCIINEGASTCIISNNVW